MMRRRTFLSAGARFAAGLAAASAVGVHPARRVRAVLRKAVYFVPGYAHESAYFEGRPVAAHPDFTSNLPRRYDGPMTLVTRLDESDGSTRRALMPLRGHEISVSRDRRHAFFNSMNGRSMLTFDPLSLELGVVAPVHEDGFICGGHSAFAKDDAALLVAERRDWAPFTGNPKDHFGRIVVRDPVNLKVLGRFDCGGIAPHEINILDDGKHVAVANYGRTHWSRREGALPEVVEPSLTVIEIASGKLVYKVVSDDRRYEVRHIAARNFERIFAIQGRLASTEDTQKAMSAWPVVYEPDVWSSGLDGYSYLPAPVLRYELVGGQAKAEGIIAHDPMLMRYAQSFVFDPRHDEAIGTFPSRHCVIVFDGKTGQIKKLVRTDRLGLRQPRGISLHPNGSHFVVSGYWMDLFAFRRGSHVLDREASTFAVLFGHSHSTAA